MTKEEAAKRMNETNDRKERIDLIAFLFGFGPLVEKNESDPKEEKAPAKQDPQKEK